MFFFKQGRGVELKSFYFRLIETNEIKAVLMKNHNDVVNQYKTKLTEQFNKMKYQLESSRTENQELNDKIAMIEQKFQEINTKKVNKFFLMNLHRGVMNYF